MTISCRTHHVSIGSIDLPATKDFYDLLGFRTAAEWTAKDGSLVLSQLVNPDGFMLEVFTYAKNADRPADLTIGNDIDRIIVNHFGFDVDDLEATRSRLTESGYETSDIVRGYTDVEYFFAEDPNGIWVEFVRELRVLDPDEPIVLHEH